LFDSLRVFNEKWFNYWLKGKGDGNFPNAHCYQTGSNKWQSFDIWPPKNITVQKLYAGANNSCSFKQPEKENAFVSYISDPARPVPYRKHPITFDGGWNTWQIEDQRFVYSRPDVVYFVSDTLTENLTVTGKIIAHLFASTSASDADWVVKLIDVYPDNYQPNLRQPNYKMNGYQFPVAMEVFRGRYRKSFEKPEPLISNKPEEFTIDLHDINHVFRRGHKLMIQVQSSWFPVIDRNPQKYVPNIFLADESDFIKAEHRIYFSRKYPTYIELPVMKE
jgi:putative CocE/NonD family hydrolase